jgi:hypothetical protein
MNKKKIYTIFLVLFFYIYGICTIKYKIFPYPILKSFYNDLYFLKEISKIDIDPKIKFKDYYKKYPNYRKKISLIKYIEKEPIWIDRNYYNQKNDEKLINYYLIKIERHRSKNIHIRLNKEAFIFRVICDLNDNSIYDDWAVLDYKLIIMGSSCVHDKVVMKKFKKGKYSLPPGREIASDPIFIAGISTIDDIEIK